MGHLEEINLRSNFYGEDVEILLESKPIVIIDSKIADINHPDII